MENKMENKITISGIATGVAFSHEAYGKYYYRMPVMVTRSSGKTDYLTVVSSDSVLGIEDYDGKEVIVHGAIRSRKINSKDNVVYIAADSVDVLESSIANGDLNMVEIEGIVCNQNPHGKYTPVSGRYILNLFLAIKRKRWRADYAPCCIWGKTAKAIEEKISQGSKIKLSGRLFSRELYRNSEFVDVYEISASEVEVINEESGSEEDHSGKLQEVSK